MSSRALMVRESLATLAVGSRSFHFASKLLPRSRRADAAVLYALCRTIDDMVDERPDDETAHLSLDTITDEIIGAAWARPLVGAFIEVAEAREIDIAHALDLIAGVRSDIGSVAIANDEELLRYCYRVASTVGLMMCGVIGVTAPEAKPHAIGLGLAMQLTNICRDVAEDAGMGRVYLPRTRLVAAGTTPDALVAMASEAMAPAASVVEDLLELAEGYYRSADLGMAHIPWRPRAAILVASRVYRGIGRKLARKGYDVQSGRTVVSTSEKIVVSLGALFGFLAHQLVAGMGDGPRPKELR